MKQIFTLLSMGMLCLASKNSFAQVNESFGATLPTCWKTDNVTISAANKGISGKGSSAELGNAAPSQLGTPYIEVTTGSVTINFIYALSGNLQNGKTRSIDVGYLTKAGVFTSFTNQINVTSTATTTFTFGTNTFSLPNGTYRIVIRGAADGANDKVLIDDLTVSGNSYHYGAAPCNTAPVATNNNYGAMVPNQVSGNVLTDGTPDSDGNIGESLTAVIVTPPAATLGTFTFNPDGTFTFKPASSFTSGSVSFTYQVRDNGYDEELSNIATVNIGFTANIILPIHMKSITGSVNNNKAQLTWNVADNETGSYFEIQKSVDGKKFENVAMLFTTAKVGDETYTYSDATSLNEGAFYRLKVVNKDNSVSYSKVIYLKALEAADTNKIMLLQNPVQSTLSFAFTTMVSEPTEIAVYNMAGVKVYSQKTMAQKGTNTINTDCNNKLTTGNYILQVSSASINATTKIVKY